MLSKREKYAVASVKAFIEKGGKILILQESSNYKNGSEIGNFVMPGGKIFEGENYKKALKREVKEETGIRIKILKPFHVDEWFPNVKGKPRHIVGIYFHCKYAGGKLHLNDEFDAYEWITPKNFRKFKINLSAKRAFQSFIAK